MALTHYVPVVAADASILSEPFLSVKQVPNLVRTVHGMLGR